MNAPLSTHEIQALDSAHFIHPFTDHGDLATRGARVIDRAEGIYIWDREGQRMLDGMSRVGSVHIDEREAEATATSMVVVLTYWLSFEYVRDPRRALEAENAQMALMRGAQHVLNLLVPYLEPEQRTHLRELVQTYNNTDS